MNKQLKIEAMASLQVNVSRGIFEGTEVHYLGSANVIITSRVDLIATSDVGYIFKLKNGVSFVNPVNLNTERNNVIQDWLQLNNIDARII